MKARALHKPSGPAVGLIWLIKPGQGRMSWVLLATAVRLWLSCADLMDQNRNPIRGFVAGEAWEVVDFSPVWYIRMC